MANEIRLRATLDDDVSRKLTGIRGEFDRVLNSKGGSAILTGVGLGAGVSAFGLLEGAVSGATKVIGDSIGAASDLQETVSKTRVIFGDSAGDIEEWAKSASRSFGQSQQAALDGVTTFATFGKGAGLAGQELEDFSTDLTELATDMASFSNTSPEEAITAIGAALRGESEPIRRYGVLLDDATLRQIAFEKGIISSVKNALTPQQRTLAAQAAIFRQTGDAQGDFARTSDSLANVQRSLDAALQDLSAEIGEVFLPIMSALAVVVRDEVMPRVSDLVQFIKDNQGIFDVFAMAADVAVNGPLSAAFNTVNEKAEEMAAVQRTANADAALALYGQSEAVVAVQRSIIDLKSETVTQTAAMNAAWEQHKTDTIAALDAIVSEMGMTRDELKAIVNDALSVVYDPLQDAIRLTALETEIAAQKRILADKDATAAEKAGAQERILALEKEREGIELTMVLHGELKGNVSELSKTWTQRWAEADAEGRKSIDRILAKLAELRRETEAPFLARFSVTGQSGSGNNIRQHGGSIWPGSWLVGESGPERMVIGANGRGFIQPNIGGSARSSSIALTVNVNGVNDPEELARQIVRPLQRELARQQITL